MNVFVSNRLVHLVAFTTSALVVWVVLPQSFFWTRLALLFVSLGAALGAFVLHGVQRNSGRSIFQVIDAVEAEPMRVPKPAPRTVL